MMFALFLIAILAGFADTIAGGGGLITLPTLLALGLPVPVALGTNKSISIMGTLMGAAKFARSGKIRWDAAFLMGGPAAFGALIGSQAVGFLDKRWMEPIVVTLICAVAAVVVFKPELGMRAVTDGERKAFSARARFKLALCGLLIGFHDGFFGPGAGTFLIFALISFGALDFLVSTATAKTVNLATNAVALACFVWIGNVDWTYGAIGAAGSVIGSFFGAGFATQKGARTVKPVFLFVAAAVAAKILFSE